jgi:hypothetical protein
MNGVILLLMLWLVSIPGLTWLESEADAASSSTGVQSVRSVRCFEDAELSRSLATLRLQGGPNVAKASESLLNKARVGSACRTQVIQGLISALGQATNNATDRYEIYFLWQNGATLLAELKATEAIDLLIANIEFTDGLSTSLNHYPAVVALTTIGTPAIPKLQIALANDPQSYRRKFAAFCIAYIGGRQARKALMSAVATETDPCLKKFLQVSLQAFDNKSEPDHVSSSLNGKWLSAFYCL